MPTHYTLVALGLFILSFSAGCHAPMQAMLRPVSVDITSDLLPGKIAPVHGLLYQQYQSQRSSAEWLQFERIDEDGIIHGLYLSGENKVPFIASFADQNQIADQNQVPGIERDVQQAKQMAEIMRAKLLAIENGEAGVDPSVAPILRANLAKIRLMLFTKSTLRSNSILFSRPSQQTAPWASACHVLNVSKSL